MPKKPLCAEFFAQGTVAVARQLLGKELVRTLEYKSEGKIKTACLRARIVETEAYLGFNDPAAHSSRGPTPRAKVMFGPPGTAYVYFIYGNYFMLNFVTEPEGTAGAVLIRAVEPLEGIPEMALQRGLKGKTSQKQILKNLTNGPGKLAMALGIDMNLNGKFLGLPHLAVLDGPHLADSKVVTTTRIGISVGQDLLYRFYEKENSFVSVVAKNGF